MFYKYFFYIFFILFFTMSSMAYYEHGFKGKVQLHSKGSTPYVKVAFESVLEKTFSPLASFYMDLGTRKSLVSKDIYIGSSNPKHMKWVDLNQLYFNFTKKYSSRSLKFKMGRFAHPFFKPDGFSLVWDGDFNPFGFTASYKYEAKRTWIDYSSQLSLSYLKPVSRVSRSDVEIEDGGYYYDYLGQLKGNHLKEVSFYHLQYQGFWKLSSSFKTDFGLNHSFLPDLKDIPLSSCAEYDYLFDCKKLLAALSEDEKSSSLKLNYTIFTQGYFRGQWHLKKASFLSLSAQYARNKSHKSYSHSYRVAFKNSKWKTSFTTVFQNQFSHLGGLNSSSLCSGTLSCKSHFLKISYNLSDNFKVGSYVERYYDLNNLPDKPHWNIKADLKMIL